MTETGADAPGFERADEDGGPIEPRTREAKHDRRR